MSLRMRLPVNQGLGHTRTRAGMAIGSSVKSPSGLSWLFEEQRWDRHSPADHAGGLSMDPVTFQRLVNFLTTHSHTGMGHASNIFSRDVDGINALSRELAYEQAADHVIGPRSGLFSEDL